MKIIRNCASNLRKFHRVLRWKIYEYNNKIRKTGFYLKPVHMVIKKSDNRKNVYYYYGRYWYKLEIRYEGRRRIKWTYVGTSKPLPHIPEPPMNPLDNCTIIIKDDDVYVDDRCYDKVVEICRGNYLT